MRRMRAVAIIRVGVFIIFNFPGLWRSWKDGLDERRSS
jgi:hypothetical protein